MYTLSYFTPSTNCRKWITIMAQIVAISLATAINLIRHYPLSCKAYLLLTKTSTGVYCTVEDNKIQTIWFWE